MDSAPAVQSTYWLMPGPLVGINEMYFEIIDDITDVEVIAVGGAIKGVMRLRRQFGPGRWRKMKGIARVQLEHGQTRRAELHWYEAHGIGRKKMKIKQFLD